MTRFVALGDSITLGVGDRCDQGGRSPWRGWAALLAEGLAEPRLHILAVSGACAADVERDQLPRALLLRPDIASVIIGVNDTLRAGFDPGRVAAAAERTVSALRAADAEVLTMRLPDPGRMLGLPGVLARPLARRAHEINLPWPSATAHCTLTPPGTPIPMTAGCGRWTACTRASAVTGTSPAGSTACSPRLVTRSGRRPTPSRPAGRPRARPSWPGSPPRARPGCCAGQPIWSPAWSRWR